MGNVLSAAVGQAPARQAALYGGVPGHAVPATTVSKVCGSGLQAAIATRAIRLGDADMVVAGGMESMSRAPYALPRAREGYRMGHGELLDVMIHDGLWDAFNKHSTWATRAISARANTTSPGRFRTSWRASRIDGRFRRRPRARSPKRSCP